ncbi:hypothetical protein HBI56_055620 [Parastagonospora nodorum]|nr:hypothetical protein HBH53_148630 [Parastagonospora nodorum]KAH3967027.1 hypothetical protein HBH51_140030 [Parastagonospora nodorum]KAH3981425.1 hypothetical protein HBH52_084260 [Parastagonospora nodorum]KAH4002889.1 hypothetical protein HBI10_068600 [Parastagonospora nodorum]KAH4026923.1 hypothetical protein HBI09_145860 [Parastagonospora nodorum]
MIGEQACTAYHEVLSGTRQCMRQGTLVGQAICNSIGIAEPCRVSPRGLRMVIRKSCGF